MASLFDYTATNQALSKMGSDYRVGDPTTYGPSTAVQPNNPATQAPSLAATAAQAAPPPAQPPATTVTVAPAPATPAPEPAKAPEMPATQAPSTGMQMANAGAQMLQSSDDDGKAGLLGRLGAAVGGIISAYTGNYGGAMAGAKKAITG